MSEINPVAGPDVSLTGSEISATEIAITFSLPANGSNVPLPRVPSSGLCSVSSHLLYRNENSDDLITRRNSNGSSGSDVVYSGSEAGPSPLGQSRRGVETPGLEEFVRLIALDSGKKYERMLLKERRKMFRSNLIACISAKRPVAALLTNPAAHLFLVLWALLYCVMAICPIVFGHLASTDEYRFFRFRVLELRDSTLNPSELTLTSFAATFEGCEAMGLKSLTSDGPTLLAEYQAAIKTTGYSFITNHETSATDPAIWEVEGSLDGNDWKKFGASHMNFNGIFGTRNLKARRFQTPDLRDVRVLINHSPIVHPDVMVSNTVTILCLASGLFGSALLGRLRSENLGQGWLLVSCLLSGTMWIVVGISSSLIDRTIEAPHTLVWGLWAFSFAVSLARRHSRIIISCAVHGGLLFILSLILEYAVQGSPLTFSLLLTSVFLLCAATVLFVHRAKTISALLKTLEADVSEWETVWQKVVDEELEALNELQQLCSMIAGSLDSQPPIQHNRLRRFTTTTSLFSTDDTLITPEAWNSLEEGGNFERAVPFSSSTTQAKQNSCFGQAHEHSTFFSYPSTIPGSIDYSRPTSNLDQLIFAAKCVAPILKLKGASWAATCHGVRVLGNHFLRDRALKSQSKAGRQPPDYSLKDPQRVCHKVLLCYGDVSRVVDLCREALICESIEAMTKVLELISDDSEVEIVRIKNRFSPYHRSESTAGFRNLIVNLKFRTAQALSIGVELHVVEVQLILKSFLQEMVPAKSTRYREFRNLGRPALSKWQNRITGENPESHDSPESPSRVQVDLSLEREQSLDATLTRETPRPKASMESTSSTQATDSSQMFAKIISLRTTIEGGFLDNKIAQGYSLKSASTFSVMFSSKPLTHAVGHRLWQVGLALFALVNIGRGMLNNNVYLESNSWSSKEFRFSVDELQGGDQYAAAQLNQTVGGFGLLRHGCTLNLETLKILNQNDCTLQQPSNNSLAVVCESPVVMDGYFFIVGHGEKTMHPSKFTVQALNDDGTLELIGKARWRISDDGTPRLLEGGARRSYESGEVVKVDMRIPWMWAMGFGWAQCVYSVGCCIIAVRGVFNRFRRAANILAVSGLLTSICGFAGALQWLAEGWWQEFVFFFLFNLGIATFSMVVWHEKYMAAGIAILSIYLIVIDVVRNAVFLDLEGFLLNPPVIGALIMFWAIVITALRLVILRMSKRVVQQDKERYLSLWDAILSSTDFDLFVRLQDLTKRLPVRGGKARHYTPGAAMSGPIESAEFEASGSVVSRSSGGSLGSIPFSLPSHIDAQYSSMRSIALSNGFRKIGRFLKGSVKHNLIPLSSLDQLYVQAYCLQPILREKVQAWALPSNGMFLKRSTGSNTNREVPEFIRWSDAIREPELQSQIKWSEIKRVERSVQKITRAYGEDMSRLVDVTREAIVFESISDIEEALLAIEADPDVVVVRVKDRLDPVKSVEDTAGFRCCIINLHVLNYHSVRLGLERHVAEVQLLLRSFAEIKSELGHRRYVAFRNARAE